ncbi:MAG: HAD-IA family hydrolase [Oligoflexia bacterium]|nr:HAD-IA family hydrolase [Oligoflexia bacterium]
MIKLIIFDLDGTLVDSAQDIMDAANKAIGHYGKEPFTFEAIKKFIGDGRKHFIQGISGDRQADPEFVKEVFDRFSNHYEEMLLQSTVFYPGALNFLNEFLKESHKKIGVVTNKEERQARLIIKGLGVPEERFVQIYGADTFEVKKPHPKPLLEMMKLAQVKPEETVMIGDSRQDIEAARAAGTHFIGVTFGYNTIDNLKSHGAEKFIDHFDELTVTMKALF